MCVLAHFVSGYFLTKSVCGTVPENGGIATGG